MKTINRLVSFVEELDRQHRHTLSREAEFKDILSNYAFSNLEYEGTSALTKFKRRVLTDIATSLLKSSLANSGIDKDSLIREVLKKYQGRDIDFSKHVNLLTYKIEALKPRSDELSLNHILEQARSLLTWENMQQGKSPRKNNVLKFHSHIYDKIYSYRNVSNLTEYLQALDKLSKIILNNKSPSNVQSTINLRNIEKEHFFGLWYYFGIFTAKFHMNGNIYVKYKYPNQAQKIEKSLMVKYLERLTG